jgi:hypothetical protein
MPLPAPDCPRKPLHNRIIRAHSFERDDGLWEIEIELIDSKSYDFSKRSGWIQKAGEPFHHMHLRVTINDELVILHAVAVHDTVPFKENCSSITPDYADLVGMGLLKGFRQQVKQRFARTAGCTHLSEIAGLLPTVAIQSMAARRRAKSPRAEPAEPAQKRPFQLEGCHAMRLDGPVVLEHYPQWYRAPASARHVDEGITDE